jgi:hypothetical protein
MTEAPVPPRIRTTPEAFPAGETDGDYAGGFGDGDEMEQAAGKENSN